MFLEYNNCKIHLSISESNYLKNNLDKNSSYKDVKNIVENLYYNSNKRYFREKHIKEISINLYQDLLLSESNLGRNLQTAKTSKLSGDNSGVITPSEVLSFNDIVNTEIGTCTSSGSDIVTLYFDNNTTETIYCDSPEHGRIIINQILTKNM